VGIRQVAYFFCISLSWRAYLSLVVCCYRDTFLKAMVTIQLPD
jgi:hypothetical protein